MPRSDVTRNVSPTTAVVIESLSSRNRASPLTNERISPIPKTTSIMVANAFSRRSRTATQTIRRPATAVAASSAGQSAAPSACNP